MEIDAKTLAILGLGALLLFILVQSGGADPSGAATGGYQAVNNLPQMVGGC